MIREFLNRLDSPAFADLLLHTYVVSANPANDQELSRVNIPKTFLAYAPDGYIGLCGTYSCCILGVANGVESLAQKSTS
jgi:hypothetical protein